MKKAVVKLFKVTITLWSLFSINPLLAEAPKITLESSYRYRFGDSMPDQDIGQYQNIQYQNDAQTLALYWYGGFRKDIDGSISSFENGFDKSDAPFQEIGDSVNPDRTLEYRIYEAYLRYSRPRYTLSLGRRYHYGFHFLLIDGLYAQIRPAKSLYLEFLAGLPVDYDYISYFSSPPKEQLAAAAKAGFFLFQRRLQNQISYIYLKQETYRSSSLTTLDGNKEIATDNYVSYRSTLTISPPANLEFGASLINANPRLYNAAFRGSAGLYRYYTSLEGLPSQKGGASRWNAFSALTGAIPYQRLEAGAGRDLAIPGKFFGLQALLLDAAAKHHTYSPPETNLNALYYADYDSLMTALTMVFQHDLTLRLFGEIYRGASFRNDSEYLGADLYKKWDKVTIKTGSAFYAYRHETDYANQISSDTFLARNFFIKGDWNPLPYLEIKTAFTYEKAELRSLTQASITDPAYTNQTIFTGGRNYYKADIRAVNRF